MITREQAEQAFREYSERTNLTLVYEIRNIQMETIDAKDIGSGKFPLAGDDLGFDFEKAAWLCTYETRYNAPIGIWIEATCYIVEAKPGPYVIE